MSPYFLRYNNMSYYGYNGVKCMKEYFEIVDVMGRRILDAYGDPTIEVEITLDDGTLGRASVPACDDNPENINTEIAEALLGLNALDQTNIDKILIDVDGSEECTRLGAGAVFASSLACARAAAEGAGLSLYNYIGGINAKTIPLPVVDLYDDGDFYLVPSEAEDFFDALCICRDALDEQEENELPAEGGQYRIISASEFNEKYRFVAAEEYATLTMLLDKISELRREGFEPVLCSSADESCDSSLADIAVAENMGFVCFGKPGMPGSSEKYNEILRIEEELSDRVIFAQ